MLARWWVTSREGTEHRVVVGMKRPARERGRGEEAGAARARGGQREGTVRPRENAIEGGTRRDQAAGQRGLREAVCVPRNEKGYEKEGKRYWPD